MNTHTQRRAGAQGSGDGGHLGRWSRDADGLPCFDLAPVDAVALAGLPGGELRRVWHQVGNDRITATAHAGGWTTLYLAERGLLRIGDPAADGGRRAGGRWTVFGPGGEPVLAADDAQTPIRTRFGMGYAEWEATAAGLRLVRRVWAPFGDLPALRIDVALEGSGAASYEESWGLVLYPLIVGGLMTRWTRPPASHRPGERLLWYAMLLASSTLRSATEALRRFWSARTRLRAEYRAELRAIVVEPTYAGPFRQESRQRPAWFDSHPPALFLAALGDAPVRPRLEARPEVGFSVERAAGASPRAALSFALGSLGERATDTGALAELLARLGAASREETARAWGRALALERADRPELAREARWHAYYLRSAQVEDTYFESRYVPQGSAYGYVHGLQGAPRDYALSAVPLTFLDPAAARSLLALMMRMTRPSGAMYYAHAGVGKCVSAVVHESPSDLPLFLLWALSEYVWASGDRDFLDARLPFYPKERGASASVRERIGLAARWLTEQLGTGEHGLLRVGSGDWSDPLAAMVPDRRAFQRRGESAFNTALAVFALPRAADLIEPTEPAEAQALRRFAAELRAALEGAWTGAWYLRGWDGRGGPVGRDHLFLDAQVWCLIAEVGSLERRLQLVRAIAERCDTPSPIGATILDRPHRVRGAFLARGWDCNGGVWAAINGLLAWAYARHDPALAWRSLEKQSLAAHARAYPHVWYGIWSGPDAYNAHYADRAGETYVHPATPMTEFPVMNSNAHALPLLALLRVLGIETSKRGIELTRPGPPGARWKLETPLLSVASDGGSLSAETRAAPHVAHPPAVWIGAERVP